MRRTPGKGFFSIYRVSENAQRVTPYSLDNRPVGISFDPSPYPLTLAPDFQPCASSTTTSPILEGGKLRGGAFRKGLLATLNPKGVVKAKQSL